MGDRPTRKDLAMARMLATPSGFGEKVLGFSFYPKQRLVLDKMMKRGSNVSFASCNGGGKTSRVITTLVLWHLFCFPKGKVVSTSGTFRQVENQLMPSLRGFEERFPAWTFRRTPKIETSDPNSFYVGFSTKESGKFEGFHDDGPDKPLLVILDEAKTIPDPVYEAAERCQPTRFLITSSPGYAEGEFYRSQTTRSEFYDCVKQTAADCPHIEIEWILKMEKKWGKDHPLVRSMIHAEFMEMIEDAIFNMKDVEDLIAEPPDFEPGDRKAFCDFAAGGDENVLAIREGNRVKLDKCWREKNTMAACGEFIARFKRNGLTPDIIEGDASGLGKVMIDRLHELGWPIGYVFNQQHPVTDEHYQHLGAEMWYEGARKVERKEVILPDDAEFKGHIISRKKRPDVQGGKLAIEKKEDMIKRGLPSPDRADAVLGALMPPVACEGSMPITGEDGTTGMGEFFLFKPGEDGEPESREARLLAGFDAGN